jgi:hypothetical protein
MKRFSVVIALVLIVIASSWALLHPGFFRAHDYVHAARIAEMTTALEEGHFPVRWTRNFGYGYGMPLFEFYAPLPYYVGSLLYWLGLPIVPSVKALFLLSSVLTAIGVYRLGSLLVGRAGGLLAAAAVTLAPYRAVNLFVRGAVSEAWGIMAMPWILVGTVLVIRGKKKGWLLLVASLVTLMLSHNIMTMLFVPFSLLFAGLYLLYDHFMVKEGGIFLRKLGVLVGSYVLAAGLTAFYTFPAVAEKDYTQVDKIFSGYFHYSQHFLYIRQFFVDNWGYTGSVWGPDDGISFFLGWGQLLGLGLAGGLVVWRFISYFRQKQAFKKIITDRHIISTVITGLLTMLALFMTLFKAKPLWDVLPLISFTQFPWRFLGPGTLFVGLLVGLSVALIKVPKLRKIWLVVGLVAILTNARYFQPEAFTDDPDQYYYTEPDRIQKNMSSILPDYIPQTLSPRLLPPLSRVTCGDFEHSLDETCEGKVEVLVDRGHEVLIKTNFPLDTRTINFAIADFPGWKAEIDGEPAEKKVSEWGTVTVTVPSGEHLVGAYFGATPVRAWSDLASLASVLILCGLLIPTDRLLTPQKHD